MTFNKINTFVADLANGSHNLATNQLAVALTDTAPTSASTSFAGEIAYTNFVGTHPNYITTTSSTQTAGLYKLLVGVIVMTASGTVPQFRYIGIKNVTTSKVIGWFDAGVEINLTVGQQLDLNFDLTNGLLQIQ